MMALRRQGGWAGGAVALLSLAAYWATAAPSITWAGGGTDSGDVATAVAVLGIAHPPGYPLFVVTGHGVARALGWIEPARAVTLYCGTLAAVGIWLVYRAARVLSGSSMAAAGGALALGLAPLWWGQANHATPHALNALFAAALVWLAIRWTRVAPSSPELFVGGAVTGLAASHHLTLLALWAGLVLVEHRLLSRVGIAGFVLGLAPWLALPIIAASEPAHAWGDPTTLAGFLDLVLARDYRGYLEPSAARVAYGVRTVVLGLGAIAFVAAAIGLTRVWDRARRYGWFVAAVVVVELGFFAAYAARDVEAYLLPAAAALVPAAAVGFAMARRWVGLAAATAVVASIAAAWPAVDLRADRAAIQFAQETLASAPAGVALVTDDDRATFALWYAHVALGDRPDVAVVDRSMAAFPWYRARLARRYGGLSVDADGTIHGRPIVVVTAPE